MIQELCIHLVATHLVVNSPLLSHPPLPLLDVYGEYDSEGVSGVVGEVMHDLDGGGGNTGLMLAVGGGGDDNAKATATAKVCQG